MLRQKLLPVLLLSFILGVHDGHIALWRSGCSEPVEVFPLRAAMLPRSDQERLKKGIAIDSAEDLAELMEDYLS